MSQKEPFDLKKFILSSKIQTDAKRPKKTKFHYTKKALMSLSKNPACSQFPECFSKEFLNDDGKWDPVKWSNEPLRPRTENESDNESVTERATRNEEKIKLQPLRRSFLEGCHVEKPKSEKFQQATKSTSRMPTFRSSHQSENPTPNSTRPYQSKSNYQPEHDYDRSSSSYRNQPPKKFQNNFTTYQGRNNGNASSSNYYNSRGPYRRNDYKDELEEPEWMKDGPVSQFDTIELTGFDDDEVTDDFSWMGEKMPTDDLDGLFKKKKKNNSEGGGDKKANHDKSEEKKTPTSTAVGKDDSSTTQKQKTNNNAATVQEDEFTDPAIQLTIKDMNDENAYKLKEAVGGGSSAAPITKPADVVVPTRLDDAFASGDPVGMTVESIESQNVVGDAAVRKEQSKTTSSRLLPFFQAPDASSSRPATHSSSDPAILSAEELPKNHHDGLLSFLDTSLQSTDGGFRANGLADNKIPGAIAMPNNNSNQTTSASVMNLVSNLSNISNAANQNHEEMNAYNRLVTNLRATDQSKQRNRNQQMLEIQKHQSMSMIKGQMLYNDPSKSNQMLQMELQKIQKLRQMDNKTSKANNKMFSEDQNTQSPFAGLSDHTSMNHNQMLSEMDGRQATASLKAKLKMNNKSNNDPDNVDPMTGLTYNSSDQTKAASYSFPGVSNSRSNSVLSTTTPIASETQQQTSRNNDAVVTTARILSRLGLDENRFLSMNSIQREQLLNKVKAEMVHKDAVAHRAMQYANSNKATANTLNLQAALLQAQQQQQQHQQLANFEAKKNLLFQPNAAAQIAANPSGNVVPVATAQQRQQMMNANLISSYNMSNSSAMSQHLLAAAAQQQRQNQIIQQQQQQQSNQVLMWNLQQRHHQQMLLRRQQQQQQQQFVVAAMQHSNLPQNSNFHAGIAAAGLHHQQQRAAAVGQAGGNDRSGQFQNPLSQWFPGEVLRHSQFPNAAGGGGSTAVTATSLEQHLANAAAAGKTAVQVSGSKVVAGPQQAATPGQADQQQLP